MDFAFERGIDSMHLLEDCLRAASLPPYEDSVKSISDLFKTKGGYSQADIDHAAFQLLHKFIEIVKLELNNIREAGPDVTYGQGTDKGQDLVYIPDYRSLIEDGDRQFRIHISTKPPAAAKVARTFVLQVPKDCDQNDELVIYCIDDPRNTFEARITEVWPTITLTLEMRLSIRVTQILGAMSDDLKGLATEALRNHRAAQ